MYRKSPTLVPFKIWGLQRTATNLTAALMRRNFRARSIERWTDWKHGAMRKPLERWKGRSVAHVVCVRNPYAWLVACHHYFCKAIGRDPTLPPQLDARRLPSFAEFLDSASYEFRNPVERWNRLYRHWREVLPPGHAAIVRLEDLLTDQLAVLARLEDVLGLKRRFELLRPIARRVDVIPNNPQPLNPDVVLHREYLHAFTPSLLKHVNQGLDRDLLKEFGYQVEEAMEAEHEPLAAFSGNCGPAPLGCDLHDFEQIRRWSVRVESVVEFGAGEGTKVMLWKRYWPDSRVLAFESCPRKRRALRAKAGPAGGVTVVGGALPGADGAGVVCGSQLKGFDRAWNLFGPEIDVLRLGDSVPAFPIITAAHLAGLLDRFQWVCGRLPDATEERSAVIHCLANAHCLEMRSTPHGDRFLARRLRPPRLRAESASNRLRPDRLNQDTAFNAASGVITNAPVYPAGRFRGKGIVICAGGRHYIPCAWVCVRMLRHLGVMLPIEMWGLNRHEIGADIEELFRPLGVRCVDASQIRNRHPARILDGWELKPYAIIYSRFREVLFLDADNVAVKDPTALFDSTEYRQCGAIFWPAYGPLGPDDPIWKICRVAYRNEPDFETGQIVIDKSRCWKALQLTMHLNENSDFYYAYTQGDKETFHMAWRMLDQPYAIVNTPVQKADGAAWQHDLCGQRIFQHRYEEKWTIEAPNVIIPGFMYEDLCFEFLEDLRRNWSTQPRSAHLL